jgi:hypothetical protein
MIIDQVEIAGVTVSKRTMRRQFAGHRQASVAGTISRQLVNPPAGQRSGGKLLRRA